MGRALSLLLLLTVAGCKCSIYHELRGLLREPRYEHVAFIGAKADREQYKLNFIDVPRLKWDHAMINAAMASRKVGS